jgi:predicted GNAT family acetyltransferase
VFLSWAIRAEKFGSYRSSLYVYGDGSRIRGVAFFGRHVVLAADDGAPVEAFAGLAQPKDSARMIVGPRRTVEAYWARAKDRHAVPRLIRKSQPLLLVDRKALRGETASITVRRAQPGEWESVAFNSAAMIREELGYDPRASSAEFDANVRMSVERGAWWIGRNGNELCFYCSEGPYSRRTLQLQGIWTPPELRGRGLATASLHGVCDALLDKYPTLSLYVNDFNAPALRLYGRLGFTQVGEFSTLLF